MYHTLNTYMKRIVSPSKIMNNSPSKVIFIVILSKHHNQDLQKCSFELMKLWISMQKEMKGTSESNKTREKQNHYYNDLFGHIDGRIDGFSNTGNLTQIGREIHPTKKQGPASNVTCPFNVSRCNPKKDYSCNHDANFHNILQTKIATNPILERLCKDLHSFNHQKDD